MIMKDSTKVLLGFAAGVAATIGIQYLAKTEKGQKVIHDLGARAEGLKKGVGDFVEKGKHMAEDLAKKFNGAPKEPVV
jgi:hypothetical protein